MSRLFDIITEEYRAKNNHGIENQIKLSLGGKKMKRILALLLVVATIFAFAACKKTDKENNGK